MNTPSHFLMTYAAKRYFALDNAPMSAVLVGSLAPDLPLYALSLGGFIYYEGVLGWEGRDAARHMYGELFYNDPVWIVLHNLLHAPLVLGLAICILWLCHEATRFWRSWAVWFLFACLFHSAVDIVTHFDDGPLILFPFEWSTRIASPVSYWDPHHYGRQFAIFELALDALLILYLAAPRLRGMLAAQEE